MLFCPMQKKDPPKRGKLLVTAALSASSMVAGCPERPLPGNPKGSGYDPELPVTSASASASAPPEIPPPGNPKGSLYDAAVMSATVAASGVPSTSAGGSEKKR